MAMQVPEGVVDLHVHIQPWQQIKDAPRKTIESGRNDVDDILRYQSDPAAFAAHLKEQGLKRVGLINYVSPKLMGFDATCNDWIAEMESSASLPLTGLEADRRPAPGVVSVRLVLEDAR